MSTGEVYELNPNPYPPAQWYRIGESMPHLADDNADYTVDVLVYGFFVDGAGRKHEQYAIGYVEPAYGPKPAKWVLHGQSFNEHYTGLVWRYLDDPPVSVPGIVRDLANS